MVELSCAKDAEIKYSTVQNWYAGDEDGKGGIYNFVTKRGLCAGDNSKISWTQVRPAQRAVVQNPPPGASNPKNPSLVMPLVLKGGA